MAHSYPELIAQVKATLIAASDAMGVSFSDSSLKPVATSAFVHEDIALPLFVLAGLKLSNDIELGQRHFAFDVIDDARAITELRVAENPMIEQGRLATFVTPVMVLEGFRRLLTEVAPTQTAHGQRLYSIHALAEHLCPPPKNEEG